MLNNKLIKKLSAKNIKILDINTTYIEEGCEIGENTTIYPNNYILKNSIIGKNCVLGENNHIENCIIGDENFITNSFLLNSKINNFNKIGPYSKINNTTIKDYVKVKCFNELNKCEIKNNVLIGSLSCVNNAEIFDNVEIGCGVNICSDIDKNLTTIISENCFIGSGCNIISPVVIGENSFISSGAIIYKNIDSNKFVIGERNLKINEDYKKTHIKNNNDIN